MTTSGDKPAQVSDTVVPTVWQLRVYGVNYDGWTRRIVAASSMSSAARIIGVSYSHMRTYGSQTGNAEEIALAMSDVGAVFSLSSKSGSKWTRLPNLPVVPPAASADAGRHERRVGQQE